MRRMSKPIIALISVVLLAMTGVPAFASRERPTAERLPLWRGFNLTEMFNVTWPGSGAFREEDFRMIADLGFNFVRLPLDYRFWIVNGDWEHIREDAFLPLDQAVEFGRRYGIHVCMNFHRAPGYTVAPPPEPVCLWDNKEALRVCAQHWRFFARRYKDIPNEDLSFNLLNEPGDIDGAAYAAVVKALVDAIHEEDPDRLVIADGLKWGTRPCKDLVPLRVAQATRGYQPFGLTHYRATWVDGADGWPVPEWPLRVVPGGYLYGPWKAEMASPLRVDVELDHPAGLTLTVGRVSSLARLRVARGEDTLHEELFTTGPGEGPWKSSRHHPEWNGYECTYDKDIAIPLPAGAYTLDITATEGDWVSLTKIVMDKAGATLDKLSILPNWGKPNDTVIFREAEGRFQTSTVQNADWLWKSSYEDWAKLRESHVGVMAGEWGAFNKTPHDVTLRWMEDVLRSFRQAGIGWALWNFRGAFGVLDSNREDAVYEEYEGHRLDRKMLDLLQRY